MTRRQGPVAALFLTPYMALFATFVVAPVIYGFWISLHNWHILSRRPAFTGLSNYSGVLNDDRFWQALWQTAYFVLLVVPAGNLISLGLAVLLNQKYRGMVIYRVALYLPVVTSVTVLAVLWRWLLNTEFGLLNELLGRNVPWLSSPQMVMPSLAMMSIWWGAGGNMIIYLAALKEVSREMLEAGELDGAGAWARFTKLTLPTIRPVILLCLVLSVIASFQVFGQSYILTGGGPADRSLTVALYMYQQGFGQYQLGYASAVAYCLFLVVFVFTALQFWGMRRGLLGG